MSFHLEFTPYTEEDFKNINKFSVYLNYLKSISVLKEKYASVEYIREIINSKSFASIQSKKDIDLLKIESLLKTEIMLGLQMAFTKNHTDCIAYSNHWISVQLYYCCYLSLRALFTAMNQPSAQNSHQANLIAISKKIKNNPDLFTFPLRIQCSGDPNDEQRHYHNLPEDITINTTNPLAKSPNPWSSYCLFLKTTRSNQLEIKRKEWLNKNKKKKLKKEQRIILAKELYYTTLFDCLYRLRIRSNYKDADTFLVSIGNGEKAINFNHAIQKIAYYSLKSIELLIARYLGKNNYKKIILNFSRLNKSGHEASQERYDSLSALW